MCQPPACCLISESFFENSQCHISEKPFWFAPNATPAHDGGRIALGMFVSDLSAVVVPADDQPSLAGGLVGDIEGEDSAVHFEIHLLVWESVVESPASYGVESVFGIARVFDSDFFEVLKNVVSVPLDPDAVPRFRRSRSARDFVLGRGLRGSVPTRLFGRGSNCGVRGRG